jgi:fused signal recognition particle receptor
MIMGLFSRLQSGLAKTRAGLLGSLAGVFSGRVDEQFYEELEEALIVADVGVQTAVELAERLRAEAKREHIKERAELWQALRAAMVEMLQIEGAGQLETQAGKLNIFIVTGVNGVGKTTTLGKLAAHYSAHGRRVLLAAADTFRAAAADQLAVWAERAGTELIRQSEGADPAAVVYDAIAAAKSRGSEVLLIDTAGRLQNKANLMAELSKIARVVEREAGDAVLKNLLVLDAGTGQNALSQARLFGEALPLSGLILTKLDGTAKGGAVVGISHESGLPVKMIGVGEGIEDLRPFAPEEFVAALFEGE